MRRRRSAMVPVAPVAAAPAVPQGAPAVPGWAPPRLAAAPDKRWDMLTITIWLYLFFDLGRIHLLFTFLRPLRPALLLAVLSILLCLGTRNIGARLRQMRHPILWLVGAIALWGAFSVPTSLNPGRSVVFLFDNLLKVMVMSLVVAIAVRGTKDIERFLGAIFTAALVYSLVALLRFNLVGGRLEEMQTYDANDLALFLVCSLPVAVYFAYRARGFVKRALLVAAVAIVFAAIVRTGSRGGFLALVAMGGGLLFGWRAVAAKWRWLAVATAVVLLLLLSNRAYWGFVGTLGSLEEDYNFTSQTGRIQVWKRGVGYMFTHPLFGVGLNCFPTAEGRLAGPALSGNSGIFKWSAAHNSFLQIGAELGIPGLLMFIALLYHMVRVTWRASRGSPSRLPRPGPELSGIIVAAVLGFIVGGFFLSHAYASLLYFLTALALVMVRLSRTAGPPPQAVWAPARR